MMYPRVALLWEFLRDDGAIFVSIDDEEVVLLRAIMDEIFGPGNFIATIVWQKKQSPQNDAINLSDMHDYIVVYAKKAKLNRDDPNGWQRQLLPREAEQNSRYSNPDNDPRGPWTSADYTCNKTADERPNLYYPIIHPATRQEVWPSRTRVWAFERDAHEQNLQDNRIWWGQSGESRPRLKKFRNEVRDGLVPSTWWTREFAGDNQEAKRELRTMLRAEALDFQTPKPVRLVNRIFQIATDRESIVMDSFAGSGTSAHAVLKANEADGGKRRFILIEMEPEICQGVTVPRIKKAIENCGASNAPAGLFQSVGGFRFCRLSHPIFDEHGHIHAEVRFADLAAHVFFTETGEPIPSRATGRTPFIGQCRDTGYYLLFNGVLGDKRPDGGNVLTSKILDNLPPHEGPRVVYGEGCRLGEARLKRAGVTFKQVPYQIRVS